jgi:uncharacterized FlaG/YvyC family protein
MKYSIAIVICLLVKYIHGCEELGDTIDSTLVPREFSTMKALTLMSENRYWYVKIENPLTSINLRGHIFEVCNIKTKNFELSEMGLIVQKSKKIYRLWVLNNGIIRIQLKIGEKWINDQWRSDFQCEFKNTDKIINDFTFSINNADLMLIGTEENPLEIDDEIENTTNSTITYNLKNNKIRNRISNIMISTTSSAEKTNTINFGINSLTEENWNSGHGFGAEAGVKLAKIVQLGGKYSYNTNSGGRTLKESSLSITGSSKSSFSKQQVENNQISITSGKEENFEMIIPPKAKLVVSIVESIEKFMYKRNTLVNYTINDEITGSCLTGIQLAPTNVIKRMAYGKQFKII